MQLWAIDVFKHFLEENKEEVKEVLRDLIKDNPEIIPKPINFEKKWLRNRDIADLCDVSLSTASTYLNEFHHEFIRIDSKLPRNSVKWLSSTKRIVEADAFEWFQVNKNMLKDETARKRVEKYKVGWQNLNEIGDDRYE